MRDGERLCYRHRGEDLAALAALQSRLGPGILGMRWRRPNLNDVFLWVNEPGVLAGAAAGEGGGVSLRPFYAVAERELVRMFRQRGRLVAAMVRPLIWLLVIGTGLDAMLDRAGDGSYRYFLVPGVVGMTMLFGAMTASLSTVNDKESGAMRMLVVAPFPHHWIVVAKTLSATAAAVVQALLLLVLLACGAPAAPTAVPIPTTIVEMVSTSTAGNIPLTEADVPRIPLEQARTAVESGAAVIIDVRSRDAYAAGHIPGAINILLDEFEADPAGQGLAKDQWIITYCS